MFHIVLFEPEIPPNTGNVMRLCANNGSQLHLVEPLGFSLDDKKLIRAGMDYRERACYKKHDSFAKIEKSYSRERIFLCTTKAKQVYTQIKYLPGDVFVFGPESRGLPDKVLNDFPEQQKIKIPMLASGRSLNLATAVAIINYEAWRQNNFA